MIMNEENQEFCGKNMSPVPNIQSKKSHTDWREIEPGPARHSLDINAVYLTTLWTAHAKQRQRLGQLRNNE
jgi:hypothetical protein